MMTRKPCEHRLRRVDLGRFRRPHPIGVAKSTHQRNGDGALTSRTVLVKPGLSVESGRLIWIVVSLLAPGFGPSACRCSDEGNARADQKSLCAQRGTVYMADRVEVKGTLVQLRAVHGGCEACPGHLTPGAPPGARCELHRVCAEVCCVCPETGGAFSVAACIGGSCAARSAACDAALGQFGTALCSR